MAIDIPFLIIGLTGPLGAGCTTLANCIVDHSPKYYIESFNLINQVSRDIAAISTQMDSTTDKHSLEELSKDLIDLLRKRAYLAELMETEHSNFIKISISELIIKIAVENTITQQYADWKAQNTELAELLDSFYGNWRETLERYNDIINRKVYTEITEELQAQIDNMFKELNILRNNIHNIEKVKFWSIEENQGLYLQELSNSIRRTGNPFSPMTEENQFKIHANNDNENCLLMIANEVNILIKYFRHRPQNPINCFVIDAFRNHSEIEYFRRRYGKFYLISMFADEQQRSIRFLRDLNINEEFSIDTYKVQFKRIDKNDSGDDNEIADLYRQNVSRCCYVADIAISNNLDIEHFQAHIYEKFLKYFSLIISPGCIQPTKEETYMNLAYSLSLRSTCISRQVGAVITDINGYVLGQGWNDVGHGQIGCGLRVKNDFEDNNFIFHNSILQKYISEGLTGYGINDSVCFKDILSKVKINKKLNKISFSDDTESDENIKEKVLNSLRIKRLEYCRSLHAEENALLQVAANGGNGVQGGVIYTTTFPCELCAKKIYQSGITKIIYTEPYPDSISEDVFLADGLYKINIQQFEGVKSSGYFKLYKSTYDKKEAQLIE